MSRPIADAQPPTYPLNAPPSPAATPVNPGAELQVRNPVTDPRGLTRTASEEASNFLGEVPNEPRLQASCAGESSRAVSMAHRSFHQLVTAGALDEVAQRLLQSPALRDAFDPQTGLTPLCLAAESGHPAIAAALLAAGAAVDARARNDSTPLMFAAFAGRVDVIRLLLSAGADPNAVNKVGWRCALHGAIQNKHLQTTQVLIEAGANPDLMLFNPSLNQANPSPTVCVLTDGWTELIAWMIATGRWALESEAMPRITLFNMACLVGSLPSVQLLLAAGANPHASFDLNGKHYKGGLWIADRRAQLNVIEYLLAQGVALSPPVGSTPVSDLDFLCPLTIDLVNHAILLKGSGQASYAGLTDLSFRQTPRKLIEGVVARQIGVLPNARGWRNWLCECGITNVIISLIDQQTKGIAALLRVVGGNQAMASRAQQLQHMTEVVSDVCAATSLNVSFSKKKMTGQGTVAMNTLVHQQRELLLQGVASLRAEQVQRLGTLASLCVENYLSLTHKLNEPDLYRFLTQEWGLMDTVALVTIRVVKTAYAQVRQVLGLSNTTVFTQLPLAEQLGLAMTHVFEELDQHTSMPEFGKALRELPAGVDIEVFAEFLFAQWRIVNHAHQVETQRFVQVGPRKPEPIATAQ